MTQRHGYGTWRQDRADVSCEVIARAFVASPILTKEIESPPAVSTKQFGYGMLRQGHVASSSLATMAKSLRSRIHLREIELLLAANEWDGYGRLDPESASG
jgi:hypothetical protein